MIQSLNEKLTKKTEDDYKRKYREQVQENRAQAELAEQFSRKQKNYLPSRKNATEKARTRPIYSPKLVLGDLQSRMGELDNMISVIDKKNIEQKVMEYKAIEPLQTKVQVAKDFRKKPLRRQDNDFLLFKEIFVNPKEKMLKELAEKEKNFTSLLNEGATKTYDKILNIYNEENEIRKTKYEGDSPFKDMGPPLAATGKLATSASANFFRSNELRSTLRESDDLKNSRMGLSSRGNLRSSQSSRMNLAASAGFLGKLESIEKIDKVESDQPPKKEVSFFDVQIQVQPPDFPNASIASPLTPGNGWAPSIPIIINLKENKNTIKDLLVRAKAGMQAGDIQKEAHLSFYLGMVHEMNKNFLEAIRYYKKFYSYAKVMEDKIGMALAANRIGINYYNDEKFDRSLEYHKQNVNLSDYENAFCGFYNLGIIYRKCRDFNQSIENFERALNWTLERREIESECIAIGQMGFTRFEMCEYETALENLSRCYEISRKIRNKKLQLDCLIVITKLTNYLSPESFENSLNILRDAHECAKQLGDEKRASICMCYMGVIQGNRRFKNELNIGQNGSTGLEFI